jgi:CheY-like chemotaxis protein
MLEDPLKYVIICIDDDPLILKLLSFQLNKVIEHETTIVECFLDPMEVVENIDSLISHELEVLLLLVDYQMPNINGGELIRNIKQKYPQMKCIMLSGQANYIIVNELTNDNLIEKFISKPWEEGNLLSEVSKIMGK